MCVNTVRFINTWHVSKGILVTGVYGASRFHGYQQVVYWTPSFQWPSLCGPKYFTHTLHWYLCDPPTQERHMDLPLPTWISYPLLSLKRVGGEENLCNPEEARVAMTGRVTGCAVSATHWPANIHQLAHHMTTACPVVSPSESHHSNDSLTTNMTLLKSLFTQFRQFIHIDSYKRVKILELSTEFSHQ